MSETNELLLAELMGLNYVKQQVDSRIAEIHRILAGAPAAPQIAGRPYWPVPTDPEIMGRDSLGRIIRPRKLSPELREKKRLLIAEARAARLDRIRAEKKAEAEQAQAAPVTTAAPPPAATETPRKKKP